ncbi:hypothetical protein FORC13_3649 [Bacillus cereus]|uniref:hypothetical protein n=1 Tax=Bacillus cereus TaxID=1396 RepID=UPI000744C9CE|nr:hypothetical protein [Bacillus cereus]ALZ62710.1 hypothetical protein FORC13_3649 [Bacillus cereus]MCB5903387.1 hypothetical protein [Bacillus cereus]TQR51502.1 hypothetical protein DJ027_08790 [Bacillus cereus]
MGYLNWKTERLNVADIYLDEENPRVFVDELTQENILDFLIDNFDVVNLAASIQEQGGLPPAERPLCIKENNKYIVVEGNRRITACKILLNQELVSKKDRKKLQALTIELEQYLKTLEVAVAPSRDSAEGYITMRHSGKGVKRWSTLAINKRYATRYMKGQSIKQIAKVLRESEAIVRKGLRFFYFIEYIKRNLNWENAEKDILFHHDLAATKLDRFLPFSEEAKSIMQISFDKNQKIQSKIPRENFDKALKIIVSRIFFTNEINTRTKIEEVFNQEIREICSANLLSEPETLSLFENFPEEVEQSRKVNEQVIGQEQGQIPEKNILESTNVTKQETVVPPKSIDEEKEVRKHHTESNGPKKLAKDPKEYGTLTKAVPFINLYRENQRINQMMKEINQIRFGDLPISTMYLIRSLLETYVNEYIDYFAALGRENSLKMKGINANREKRNKTLRELIFNDIYNHLKNVIQSYSATYELINVVFTENNNTSVMQIINYYIHSASHYPDKAEIIEAWMKISTILHTLDELLYKNKLNRK